MLRGLMMDYQLTIPAMLQRAETLYGHKEIVTRLPDKRLHRYTYSEMVRRTKQLALALRRLGVSEGDRVATLCWNHYQHLEAYFAIPSIGAVLHTLNLRLPPDDLAYVIDHAGDRVLLVDEILLPVFERVRGRVSVERVLVVGARGPVPEGMLDYEQLLAAEDPTAFTYLELDERQAAAMCYTSGTTGRPKGVLYSHRAIVLHSICSALPDAAALSESDVVMPVVPMFHVNAWGMPFTATLLGCKQVFPGPHLDPQSLAELIQAERVTFTCGVPTLWLGLLQLLDKQPGAYDLSSLRAVAVGGQSAPLAMIKGFQERHGIHVYHGWGMTETTPIGLIVGQNRDLLALPLEQQYYYRATAGRPLPFFEIRSRNDQGLVPWDGETMGELEVRGPWVANAYYNLPEGADAFTEDGWLRTGDIVTIDPYGWVQIQDRAKDVVKSGGEWISSVRLENAIMAHPAVAEAAVIPARHPKWIERPVAVVVLKEGQQATPEELAEFLASQFPKWWLPDAYVFVPEIPKTSTGKFMKLALRERYENYLVESGLVAMSSGEPTTQD